MNVQNLVPHFFYDTVQTDTARHLVDGPPPSTVNILWGCLNFAIGSTLISRVVLSFLMSLTILCAGTFVLSPLHTRHFGTPQDGNDPKRERP